MASLTPASFRLDSDPPIVVCEAGYTKNGRHAEQPVADSLAGLLRPWVALLTPGHPVFDLTDRTAEMIRVDLEAAGIAYETPSGVIDFHALRHTYISMLVQTGVSVKVAQELARHSTPMLTIGRYSQAFPDDVFKAVTGLPDPSRAGSGPENDRTNREAVTPRCPTGAPRRRHLAAFSDGR